MPLFASPSFDVLPVDKLDEAAARRMSVYAPELSDLDIAEKRAEKPMPRVHVISEALDAEMHKLFDAQVLLLTQCKPQHHPALIPFCALGSTAQGRTKTQSTRASRILSIV